MKAFSVLLLLPVFAYSCNLSTDCQEGNIDPRTCCRQILPNCSPSFKNFKNCSTYYQCLEGIPFMRTCPFGTQWSVKYQKCDYPEIANCVVNSVSPPKDNCGPEPICRQCLRGVFPSDLCCQNVETYYKIHLANLNDSTSYYQCMDGHAVQKFCPEGLQWSVEDDRCEWPEGNNFTTTPSSNYSSTTTPTPEEGSNTTFSPNNTFIGDCQYGRISAEDCCNNIPETIDVLLQNNENCHTYFQCVHGKPLLRDCPPATVWWSAIRNRCETYENASCTWDNIAP